MYGQLPKEVAKIEVDCKEMFFYQYLPIKIRGNLDMNHESRLDCFQELVMSSVNDFIISFGHVEFKEHYIYLTAKRMYQTNHCPYNRLGYHSDGFLSDDINYIWSDVHPTIFNFSKFDITLDDSISIEEMQGQALSEKEFFFENNTLLRLNQFNVHKVNDSKFEGIRTFFKLSFSKDKYDLLGNSHNYELDYKWEMKERKPGRNIPQSKITTN